MAVLHHLLISLSVAAGVVSAGYGGRGVIPSAADLGPIGSGPDLVSGGATSWVPSKGVRPRPRPIVFPGSTGQIDPGFAPKPWITPGFVPGAQPIPGGTPILGGGTAFLPGGKPGFGGGGYRGGVFHGGRPSYAGSSIYGTDGSVVGGAGGKIDGLGPVGGIDRGGPLSGGTGEIFVSGGGIGGTPILEPAGGVVKPINGISGKPLDGTVGGAGHGGVVESVEGKPGVVPISGIGIGDKPLVTPVGSEVAVKPVGGGGSILVKPGVESSDVGGLGSIDGDYGTGFGVKPGTVPVKGGGLEGVIVNGGGGGPVGGTVDFIPGTVPIGEVPVDGTVVGPIGGGQGGVVDVKPGTVPIGTGGGFEGVDFGGAGGSHVGGGYSGGGVVVKPGTLPGVVDSSVIDGTVVGPIGGGSHDGFGLKPGKVPVEGTGFGSVEIDGAFVKPSGGVHDGNFGVKPGLEQIEGGGIDGLVVDSGAVGPVNAGVDGVKVVPGGSFGEEIGGGGVGGIGPVGGGTYGAGTGFGQFEGKPVLGPSVAGGVKGIVPVTGAGGGPNDGFESIGTGGAHGLSPGGAGIDLSGGKAVIVPGGGGGTDTVKPLGDGGTAVLGPTGGIPVPSGGNLGGTGLGGFGGKPHVKPLDGAVQPFDGLQPGVVYGGGAAGGIKNQAASFGAGGHKHFLPVSGGASVGSIESQVPPFGTGGQKPFLPVTGDRAVGEVHPGFEPVGGVDGIVGGPELGGTGLGGTGLTGGAAVDKPVADFGGAGTSFNKPYKPPRRYGRR